MIKSEIKNIEIDLSQDTNNYVFDEKHQLFSYELQIAFDLINNYKKTNKYQEFNKTIYNTILIDGSRGCGKTTFLSSLKYYLDIKENSLCILPILDPTLIENKAHIFVTILSQINQLVTKSLNEVRKDNEYSKLKKEWDEHLVGLSKGMPSIYTNQPEPEYWDSADNIFLKDLESVNSAFYLRERFTKLLQLGLTILKKDKVLLLVDDIDTDPSIAWPLLETIRKHICSDSIITVLSTDFNQLSLIVRNELLKKLPVENNIGSMVDEYLKKIFPIDARIKLPYIVNIHNRRIKAIDTIQLEKIVICDSLLLANDKYCSLEYSEFLRRLFLRFGIINPYQREAFETFVSTLSLRTLLAFLKVFRIVLLNTEHFYIDLQQLQNVFYIELLENSINTNLLSYNSRYINSQVLKFLIRQNILSEAYQLQPIYENQKINSVLTFMSLFLSNKISESISYIFDYFIRIAYMRNVLALLGNNYSDFERLANISGIYADKDLRLITCFITSFCRGQFIIKSELFYSRYLPGIEVIRGFSKKAKKATSSQMDRFDIVLQNESFSSLIKSIACIPLSISESQTNNNSINEYSFFTLLSSIYDFIRMKQSGDDIITILNEYSHIRAFPQIQSFTNVYETNKASDFSINVVINEEDSDTTKFKNDINNWLAFCENMKKNISPYVLGKIITRAYSSFSKISDKAVNRTSLGRIMHLFVCSFVNSVIIEECAELTADINGAKPNIKINKNNLITDESMLIENIKKIKDLFTNDYLPLTKLIISCPLLLMFMDVNSSELGQLLDEYFFIPNKSELFIIKDDDLYKYNKSVYTLLSLVSLSEIPEEKIFFTSDNFYNVIEIIKGNFSYEEFLNEKEEVLGEKLESIFKLKSGRYKVALKAIRKRIVTENIKW